MSEASTYVGLDVHKDSIDVTLAEAGAAGEVRHFGTIGGDLEAIAHLLRRLRRKGRTLHSCTRPVPAASRSTAS